MEHISLRAELGDIICVIVLAEWGTSIDRLQRAWVRLGGRRPVSQMLSEDVWGVPIN